MSDKPPPLPPASGGGEEYNRLADKVGLLPNVRKKDNLYQALCVGGFVVAGMGAGWWWDGAAIRDLTGDGLAIRMVVGALVGLIVGTLLSGLVIMVLGLIRNS